MQVKIILEGNETDEDASEELAKALKQKEEAYLAHDKFADPEMEKIAQGMISEFEKMQEEMLAEIDEALNAK